MSWLSGLAGKAEDLLNKIDQNAAIALQKGPEPQVAVDNSTLVEVNSRRDSGDLTSRKTLSSSTSSRHGVLKQTPTIKSYPSIPSASGASVLSGKLRSSAAANDDELMEFLNSPKGENKLRKKKEAVDGRVALASPSQQITPKVSMLLKSKTTTETEVNSNLSFQKQSKGDLSIEVPTEFDNEPEDLAVVSSDGAVRRELRAREQEVLSVRGKLWESQQEVDQLRSRLMSAEGHLKEVEGMYSCAIEDSKKIAEAAIAGRFQAESELDRLRKEFSYSMDDKTHALELLKSKMEGELVAANNRTRSLQRRYDAVVEELREERVEQEKYRARAQAVLAGRDREIAELRANGMSHSEPCAESVEVGPEWQMWEEEAVKLREEVVRVRLAADDARRQWEGERESMEDELVAERVRREAAEEQEKATLMEVRGLRAEVDRLREQELHHKEEEEEERKTGARHGAGWQVHGGTAAMARNVADDSISERLAALTSALIEKQMRVESLTGERNALRLQLEKTDHLYRDAIAHLAQGASSSLPGQNDTDDVKARIPAFLMESPFDTVVARRVKRAYSSLDSVGVRVGIFLRRYPLARTLLLSYTVLLHLWVAVVLLTYTPDVH